MGILIVLSLVMILIVIFTDKNWKYNPVFLFDAIWFIIFLMYAIDLFKLEFVSVEESSILILSVMLVSFSMGGLLGIRSKKSLRLGKKSNNQYNFKFRENGFFAISSIAAIVMFTDEIGIIIRLINGSSFYSIIRDAAGKETVSISGVRQVLLYLFIVYPVTYMISPVCAAQFFSDNKNKKYYLFLNIMVVALSVVHHGGRNALFLMMISYVLVFIIKSRGSNMKTRTKIMMAGGLGFAFILINGISDSRGIDSIWESFYAYMTCSIPLMQIYLKSGIINGTRLCGFYSFNGFTYPIVNILSFLGFPKMHIYEITQSYRVYVEESMNLVAYAYNHQLNAFMPAGAYFYVDGGIIFEILGMFFYGLLVGRIYRKVALKKGNFTRNLTIYTMLVIGLILSFSRFWFTSYGYAIGFIYIFLLFGKDTKRRV